MISSIQPARASILASRTPRACLLKVAVFFLLSLALIQAGHAAITPDGTPKDWPANAEKHSVTVRRAADSESDRRLISAAEAAQPPAADVRKAAGEVKLPEKGNLWWYKEELGLRIPYAVTGDAVAYFTKLIKQYGQQAFNRYAEPSSRIEYTAGVTFHADFMIDGKSFQNVHVVTLKLHFSQNFCATGTEGLSFTKERVVVFDAHGKVLHIAGDGPTETPILAI